jgi:hypothetical protein
MLSLVLITKLIAIISSAYFRTSLGDQLITAMKRGLTNDRPEIARGRRPRGRAGGRCAPLGVASPAPRSASPPPRLRRPTPAGGTLHFFSRGRCQGRKRDTSGTHDARTWETRERRSESKTPTAAALRA